jgi:hypothetical protein
VVGLSGPPGPPPKESHDLGNSVFLYEVPSSLMYLVGSRPSFSWACFYGCVRTEQSFTDMGWDLRTQNTVFSYACYSASYLIACYYCVALGFRPYSSTEHLRSIRWPALSPKRSCTSTAHPLYPSTVFATMTAEAIISFSWSLTNASTGQWLFSSITQLACRAL